MLSIGDFTVHGHARVDQAWCGGPTRRGRGQGQSAACTPTHWSAQLHQFEQHFLCFPTPVYGRVYHCMEECI